MKVWVINLGGDTSRSNQVAIYKNAKGEWKTPEDYREEREGHRQAVSRIASEQLGIRVIEVDWQHLGEEVENGITVQSWVYYHEEIRQQEAHEIVRIGGQMSLEDSVAVRWVELQRFYMILLAGKIITKGRFVGIPFRVLLRTRFPHVVVAAKEEVASGLG